MQHGGMAVAEDDHRPLVFAPAYQGEVSRLIPLPRKK
jgi:hypothetical protein